eukprot:GHVQ01009355.1.p1 GENE.GHVQ01009355.1~~GHVQ01009355.1.p1  ORF type:complete len:226 (-),score=7.44 GHVQ01009355.1:352-1029(-)
MRITTKTLVEVLVVVVRSALCVLPFISTVVVATNSGVVPRTSGISFSHKYFEDLVAGLFGMMSMGFGAYGYGVYDYYTELVLEGGRFYMVRVSSVPTRSVWVLPHLRTTVVAVITAVAVLCSFWLCSWWCCLRWWYHAAIGITKYHRTTTSYNIQNTCTCHLPHNIIHLPLCTCYRILTLLIKNTQQQFTHMFTRPLMTQHRAIFLYYIYTDTDKWSRTRVGRNS